MDLQRFITEAELKNITYSSTSENNKTKTFFYKNDDVYTVISNDNSVIFAWVIINGVTSIGAINDNYTGEEYPIFTKRVSLLELFKKFCS